MYDCLVHDLGSRMRCVGWFDCLRRSLFELFEPDVGGWLFMQVKPCAVKGDLFKGPFWTTMALFQ